MPAWLQDPVVREAIGLAVAALALIGVDWLLRKHKIGRARSEQLTAAIATAVDALKARVRAEGDQAGATLLRDLTRGIARESTATGTLNLLDAILADHGLNTKPDLRETLREAPRG